MIATKILTETEKNRILKEFQKGLSSISKIIEEKNSAGYSSDHKRNILEQNPKIAGVTSKTGVSIPSGAIDYATTGTNDNQVMSDEDARKMLGYDPTTGEVTPEESVEGYFAAKTPNGKAMYFPNDAKKSIRLFDTDDPSQIELFKKWLDNNYNRYTDYWVPSKLSDILSIGSVSSFTTGGKRYTASFENPELKKFKTWTEFETWTNRENGRPKSWTFIGYNDESGKPYEAPPPPSSQRTWYENFWKWIKDGGWQILAEVIASVVVGILTAGMSLVAQAAFQIAVGVAFSIDDIARGDYLGAAISIIVSAIPLGFSAAKFGVKDVDSFLKRFGPSLKNVKTAEDFAPVWAKMSDPDKLLLTRAFKQTPGELKAATNKMMIPVLQEQVAKNPDYLMKIPFAQRKMWKDIFVEGGVSLTTGLGLSVAAANYQEKKEVEKGIENIKNQDFSQMQADFGKLTPVQQDSTLQADLQRLNQLSAEDYSEDY